MQQSRNKYMEIREIYGTSIRIYGIIYKIVGNGWEIVGVYPTYVLLSGAFLAGAVLFVKSRPLSVQSAFLIVFMIKPPFL